MNWEKFKTGPDGTDLPIDVELGEPELLAAFDRWIHTAHPNPERTGCPGRSVLTILLLSRERFEDECMLAHIGHCAPCLDDLEANQTGIEDSCFLSMSRVRFLLRPARNR